MRQAACAFQSLASAASSRTSARAASRPARRATESIANVSAAIRPTITAIASCSPRCAPHCVRVPAQARVACSIDAAAPAQLAGTASRPVLSVVSASLSPLPTAPSTFSFGTRTPRKRSTPFSSARNPMKLHRCSTSNPGVFASTTKAVICRLPFTSGVRAITTRSSAMVPLVHQIFSPSRSQLPSSSGTAVVFSRAGSEPAPSSVSAKALIAPAASRGSQRCFCSAVPNIISGCGRPIDWCAESSAATFPQREAHSCIAAR